MILSSLIVVVPLPRRASIFWRRPCKLNSFPAMHLATKSTHILSVRAKQNWQTDKFPTN